MVEYISRKAAIDCLMEILDKPHHAEFLYTDEICGALNSIPAADVRPVVRGKWIVGKSKWNAGLNSYTCSICGGAFQDIEPTKFCPDCGAKMEGLTMYEDLIKRLRNRRICIQQSGGLDDFPLLKEAADAIEELQKAVNFHKFNSEFWEDKYNSLADEKWIPVMERLPEEEVPVQVTYLGCTDKQPRTDMIACIYCGKWCYWDGEPCSYEECRVEITHWRPLPEPLEEDET